MERNTVALQQWVLGGAVLAIGALTASAAQAAPLEEFQYNPQADQLSFVLPDGVMPRYFLMAQPARIVVDIPDTQIGDLPLEQRFSGAVKRIEVTQVQPQLARIILEMSPQAVFARGQVSLQNVGDAAPQKDRWVLKPLLANAGVPAASNSPSAPLAERAARPSGGVALNPSAPAVVAAQPLPSGAKPVLPAAKPAPAVELPPGMESVLGAASPLPNLPIVSDAPVVTPPPAVAPAAPPLAAEPAPLPNLGAAPTSPVAATPLPNPAPIVTDRPKLIAPSPEFVPPLSASVPIARLPEAAPTPDVPPPPPLLQATIINRAPANPNSPAALVTPDPVMRPDLRAASGSSPLVSVPPLASIVVPSSPPLVATPNLPPAPPLPLAGSATLPTLLPGATSSGSSNLGDLPPLPDVSLQGKAPTNLPTASPTTGLPPTAPWLIASLPPTSSLPPTALPVAPTPMALPSTGIVEFGQRLPSAVAAAPNPSIAPSSSPGGLPSVGTAIVALDNLTTGGVVVPAGTLLSLRYDQTTGLKLKSGQRQQGVFSLQSPIVDARGRVLAASGSLVLGEFATSAEGSRFTTQALSAQNRNLSLLAQSDLLKSTKRVSNDRLLQNSGIGAVAGAILGGLNGSVLGGAAAGAAITYAISPKETILQPGQLLQVKLVQDFFTAR